MEARVEGLELSSLQNELHKVAPEHDAQPIATIEKGDQRLGKWLPYLKLCYSDDFSFYTHPNRIPLEALSSLTFDEIVKMSYGQWMHESIRELFDNDPSYGISAKIESSLWQWGVGSSWNELVDAYNCIRSFVFVEHPDFEVRLDHAPSHNECGWSKYTRTFLDGAFGFLIYYKKKHVMTLGFSVAAGKRLLIQQVQLKEKTGNRFLFKLPRNRLEFVIGCFRKCFKGYQFYLIDGRARLQKTLSQYKEGLKRVELRLARRAETPLDLSFHEMDREEEREYRKKIAHLEADMERIVAFYQSIGEFAFRSSVRFNTLPHRHVVKPRILLPLAA